MLNRIVDILLVGLMRIYLARHGPAHAHVPSWLSALTDPVAGSALAVLHAQPGRDWTIPSLAAAIGVSPRHAGSPVPPSRWATPRPPRT